MNSVEETEFEKLFVLQHERMRCVVVSNSGLLHSVHKIPLGQSVNLYQISDNANSSIATFFYRELFKNITRDPC